MLIIFYLRLVMRTQTIPMMQLLTAFTDGDPYGSPWYSVAYDNT